MSTTSSLWHRVTHSSRAALQLLLVAVALIMPPAYNTPPATAQFVRFTAALPQVMRPYPDGIALIKTFQSISKEKMVILGDTLYFIANDGTSGSELWKSDGTEQGTRPIRNNFPHPSNLTIMENIFYPSNLTIMENIFYFYGISENRGALWKSDGTEQGTSLVKDYELDWSPEHLTVVNNTLYFSAYDQSVGRELWKSDGTEQGTSLVKDIYPGSGSGLQSAMTNFLIAVGDTLYFVAYDGTHGGELWKSDGTEQGTTLVKDIYPGAGNGLNHQLYYASYADKENFGIAMNEALYFAADDGVHGRELWKSDGTEQGTTLVKDIHPPGSYKGFGKALIVVGSTLYFTSEIWEDGVFTSYQLWKSDGTEQGTTPFKNLDTSRCPYLAGPVLVNDMLYFAAYSRTGNGIALWKSDGSEQGTMPVKLLNDIPDPRIYSCTALYGADIYITAAANQLFFTARSQHGEGCSYGRCSVTWYAPIFWRSDGTEQGTIPIRMFLEKGLVLSESPVIVLGDMLYLLRTMSHLTITGNINSGVCRSGEAGCGSTTPFQSWPGTCSPPGCA